MFILSFSAILPVIFRLLSQQFFQFFGVRQKALVFRRQLLRGAAGCNAHRLGGIPKSKFHNFVAFLLAQDNPDRRIFVRFLFVFIQLQKDKNSFFLHVQL